MVVQPQSKSASAFQLVAIRKEPFAFHYRIFSSLTNGPSSEHKSPESIDVPKATSQRRGYAVVSLQLESRDVKCWLCLGVAKFDGAATFQLGQPLQIELGIGISDKSVLTSSSDI